MDWSDFRLSTRLQLSSDVTERLYARIAEIDAIKNTLKMSPKDYNSQGIRLDPHDVNGQAVDVRGDWVDGPVSTIKDTTSGAHFPTVVTLFGGQPIDGRIRYTAETYRQVNEDTTLPAFNPEFLADISKLGGTTQALKKGMLPWQMTWVESTGNVPERGGFKPWAWSTKSRDNSLGITYLLMPVNPKLRGGS